MCFWRVLFIQRCRHYVRQLTINGNKNFHFSSPSLSAYCHASRPRLALAGGIMWGGIESFDISDDIHVNTWIRALSAEFSVRAKDQIARELTESSSMCTEAGGATKTNSNARHAWTMNKSRADVSVARSILDQERANNNKKRILLYRFPLSGCSRCECLLRFARTSRANTVTCLSFIRVQTVIVDCYENRFCNISNFPVLLLVLLLLLLLLC